MNKLPRNIQKALKESGAVMVRQKRHYVYRVPDGALW